MTHKKPGSRFIKSGRAASGRAVSGRAASGRAASNRVNAGAASVGAIFEAEVIALADTGNAVVQHSDGRRFFVAGAWLGERIRLRVKELKSQYGIGELVEVLSPSPARVQPLCGHQGYSTAQCGGCPWMFVSYDAQLNAKQQRVEQAIRRLQPKAEVQPIVAAPEPFGYRIRAQLKTDGMSLGFVANGQRRLAAIEDCLVLTEHNRATLTALRGQLPNPAWRPATRQEWTTLDIDESVAAEQVSINKRLPFQQANRRQNAFMRQWLASQLDSLSRQAPVLELFAGSGNFTQVLAAAGFHHVTAVEVVPEAVAALAAQNLPGVEGITCDLFDEQHFADLLGRQRQTEVLVLDPPRDGLKCRAGLFDKKSRLRHVIYISCDLATLCRDLRDFIAAGFEIHEVQPVDLFPQTPHVELLVSLRRSL